MTPAAQKVAFVVGGTGGVEEGCLLGTFARTHLISTHRSVVLEISEGVFGDMLGDSTKTRTARTE